MKEKIFNIQKQNNDLKTEKNKVSALKKLKHKLADDKGQSICVASPWNNKVGQDSTKTMWILTANTQIEYLRKVQNLRNIV